MPNATEHYREAERLAALAAFDVVDGLPGRDGHPITLAVVNSLTARAQVHATLALAAAHGADNPYLTDGTDGLLTPGETHGG
jgi:hypothetical protein